MSRRDALESGESHGTPGAPRRLSRRSFLAGLQVAAGGLALGLYPRAANARLAPPGRLDPKAEGLQPNVFVHVAPTGDVTFVCHRSEMGQGVRSSLPVLFADELGADMARVSILQADGDKAFGNQNTDGSSSVRGVYNDLRRTAAAARELLVKAGAKALKVRASECRSEGHRIVHAASGRSIAFGEIATAAGRLPVPALSKVALRPEAELKHVGGDLPLLDARAYVTGKAEFGADRSAPGMLVAVIARPPVVGGRVLRFDESAALAVPGVRRVVRMPEPTRPYIFQPWGGIAVLADNTWAAMTGRARLGVEWEHGPNAVYNSTEYRKTLASAVSQPGKPIRNSGDTEAVLASAAQKLEAEYFVPHQPHAPMEPPVALAQFEGKHCEIWTSTQNPQAARKEAARVLATSEENVTVHVSFLGGGFGRKSKADFVAEAAWLAREVERPVRVQWSREDDIQHDYYNTVSHQRLTAGLDAAGKVTAWRHRTAFPPIGTLWDGPPVPSAGDLQQGVLDLGLAIPNVRAEGCAAPAYARIGWLRSVYNIFHAFSVGSFIDELAELKGQDPLETWLEVLGAPRKITSFGALGVQEMSNYGATLEDHPVDTGRLRGVIERVVESSGWAHRKSEGRHLGLAAHRSFLSYVAVVVSVVEGQAGRLVVDEAWVAADAGKLLNRDRVRSQMEGAVIFGMSLTLHGGITFKDGAVEQTNFRDMKVLRMAETPRAIHVDLVESNELPGGVGEPGVPPVAPAIANAAFALRGQRYRDLPISPVATGSAGASS